MSDVKPMCVKHKDGWCALLAGRDLDPRAMSDDTECGHTVIMRIGHRRMAPTCHDCRRILLDPKASGVGDE